VAHDISAGDVDRGLPETNAAAAQKRAIVPKRPDGPGRHRTDAVEPVCWRSPRPRDDLRRGGADPTVEVASLGGQFGCQRSQRRLYRITGPDLPQYPSRVVGAQSGRGGASGRCRRHAEVPRRARPASRFVLKLGPGLGKPFGGANGPAPPKAHECISSAPHGAEAGSDGSPRVRA
jgi:hypothetical protein